MDIYNDMSALNSVKQAIGIATMRMSMNQDAQSVATVIDSMQKSNAKAMELSVTPNVGSKFDVSV